MDQKLYSITKNKDDIIFLCDLRLNSPHQVAGMNDLNKKFGFYGYKLYHHSRKSSRGVGILISKKVDHQVHGTKTDAGDNFILLIGGDWNTTWDNSAVNLNIDVVNMVNIPSKRKSDKLRLICAELNLCDPYRIFHPTRREYTFIPSAIGMLNRSRLDFFVISEGIVNKISNCMIPHSLTSTVFDHKPIFMSTNSKKFPNKQQINDVILDDPDLLYHIKISVFDS